MKGSIHNELTCGVSLRNCEHIAQAAVEHAISLRGRFTSNMQDMVETHVLSMCMVLHSNLPP